jgi:hypothetical protein
VDRPSADAFLDAFGGRFYVPVSQPIAGWLPFGWRAYDGEPESLGLVLTLGPRRERCVVRTGVRPESTTAIVHDLLFRRPEQSFRFPLTVERAKTRITVQGRERVFTSYSYRGEAVATAAVRDLYVTVQARSKDLAGLQLGLIEPGRLRDMLDSDVPTRTA